ncbi:MAG: PspC domain-containing protein [Planctomycetota bacterium]|jgi:phage shock protein C
MAKQLTRSTADRMLAGVCGGLAKYIDLDPTVVRLLTVLLALTTAGLPVLITYVVAALIVPEDTAVSC